MEIRPIKSKADYRASLKDTAAAIVYSRLIGQAMNQGKTVLVLQ